MGRRKKYSDKVIIEALRQTYGLVSKAAKILQCSPQTIYQRAELSPGIQEAIKENRDELVDEAELQFRSAILKGEAWAIALALKTLGKDRGYVERTETQSLDDKKIEVVITHETKPYPSDTAPNAVKSE